MDEGDDPADPPTPVWGPPRPVPGQAAAPPPGTPWHPPPNYQFTPPPAPVDRPAPHEWAPPPRRRRTGRLILGLLGLVVVLGGLAGGGLWLWDRFGAGSDAYEAVRDYRAGGRGTAFSDPEAGFSAVFPAEPERRSQTERTPAGRTITYRTFSVASSEAEFIVFVLQAPGLVDLEQLVPAFLPEGGRLESSTPTTFLGHPALQSLVIDDDLFLESVWIQTPDRVYTISVTARENPPLGFDRFRDSFQIQP